MKKKYLKAIKKQDQDIRAKKAVGIWKRRTWRRGLGRKGSGAVTPVTAPVTRAGSENEDEDDDSDDGNEDEANGSTNEDREEKMVPIRRRSEGVTVAVPHPPTPQNLTMQSVANQPHPASQLPSHLPPPPPTSLNAPTRRPSIGITLRKLSVPGIRRRSTAPEGEGWGGAVVGVGSRE